MGTVSCARGLSLSDGNHAEKDANSITSYVQILRNLMKAHESQSQQRAQTKAQLNTGDVLATAPKVRRAA